jgi:D-alanyl-D-alanine carboxypeptidase
VTCQTYVIIDPKKTMILFSKNENEVREMASLTKIMTAIISLQLATELKLDIKSHYFKVSRNSARTNGTTANLTEN